MLSDKKTYVFNDTEVVLTGRQSQRAIKRRTERSTHQTVVVKVEVTPADPENGSWKKWVNKAELFEIREDPPTED